MERTVKDRIRRKARRRRLMITATVLILLVIGLTLVETQMVDLGAGLPGVSSILIFTLINANTLLLLLLLFLTGRNLVNLVFERRTRVMGAKLKTKLVISFLALSIIPTAVLFFVVFQFISTSIEYWFNVHTVQLDKSLRDSLHVGRLYYQTSTQNALLFGQDLVGLIVKGELLRPDRREDLKRFVESRRREFHFTSIKIITPQNDILAEAEEPFDFRAAFTTPTVELITSAFEQGKSRADIVSSPLGDYLSAVIPIAGKARTEAALVLSRLTPAGLMDKLNAIARGLEGYQQLKMVKGPIKLSHYLTLLLAATLVLFGAIWFGFKLAKTITVPLQDLADATQRLAAGDYDVVLDPKPGDEIGTLIDCFNRMTGDLRLSKEQLEQTNRELLRANQESESRRRYMEIVLASVAAGVVTVDAGGIITTVNKSAEQILGIQARDVLGRHYSEVLAEDQRILFDSLAAAAVQTPTASIERHIRLLLQNRNAFLLLRLSGLKDETGRPLGWVLVMEDLTDLEKAQRMSAWREVARRIAHEIKNPLTPIKLSAQRLKKRFGEEVGEKDVFDKAIQTITNQVDTLKGMVDEFSSFARMPAINIGLADLPAIVQEAIQLYQDAHKNISFQLVLKNPPPPFYFDAEQVKRVLINLLDNAVAALEGQADGRVSVRITYLDDFKIVRLEVVDNGPGIKPENKERLFEPYFSTKKHGTGLGLAIVNTVIQDHSGYIRVQDNSPRGTKFIIELPVEGWSNRLEA